MSACALICLPGLLCTPDVWDEAVVAAGMQTQPQALSGDSIALAAATVVAGAPARFILAGFSLGGYVALEIMRSSPGRVAGLLLVSTSARADTDRQRAARGDAVEAARDVGLERYARDNAPLFLSADGARQPRCVDRLARMAAATPFESYAAQQRAIGARRDQRDLLASMRCPTAIVVGGSDRVTPPVLSAELAAAIPHATLETVSDCGHHLLIEAPAVVGAALMTLAARVATTRRSR